jgi:uncharacterized protein (TIGR00251 family)
MSPILHVRVKPQARRPGVVGRHGDGIKVAVRAVPERGRANHELLDILAAWLGVAAGDLEIVAGAGSQDKRVRVHGLEEAELRRRVEAAVGPGGAA